MMLLRLGVLPIRHSGWRNMNLRFLVRCDPRIIVNEKPSTTRVCFLSGNVVLLAGLVGKEGGLLCDTII